MKLSVELTLYPLQDNYLPVIEATLEKLNSFDGILVETFQTGTIVEGDHQQVMDLMSETIQWSYDNYGKCVFVAKFLPGFSALSDNEAFAEYQRRAK